MTAQTNPYISPRCAAARKRQQFRRRKELISFLFECLVTMGIGASFIFCSILFLCVI